MKINPLTSEELKKEHPEMYIPADVWDAERVKERKKLYDLLEEIKEENQ